MPEPGGLTEKSRLSTPLFLALTILISTITGTAAAVASWYGLKETTLERIETRITEQSGRMRQEQQEALTHYLSLEKFAEWRQQERVRTDAQAYAILAAIDRLRVSVESRHR